MRRRFNNGRRRTQSIAFLIIVNRLLPVDAYIEGWT
jgi:hypothetical protein